MKLLQTHSLASRIYRAIVNNKNFDKFEELFVSMDVFRDIYIFFKKISLINMKILDLCLKVLSQIIKKEKIYCPLPPWDAPGKKYFFFQFLRLIWKFCNLSLKVLSLIIKKTALK